MKNVSQTPTTPKEDKKRTKVIKTLRITLAGFLSLLVWVLHFIGKVTEVIEDMLKQLKDRL